MTYLLLEYDVERTNQWNEVDLSLEDVISVRKVVFPRNYLFTVRDGLSVGISLPPCSGLERHQ